MLMMRSIPLLAIALALLAPPPARASQELRDELAGMAKEILANTKNQPVTVGQFSPTDLPSTNAAVGIEQVLVNQLKAIKAASVSAEALFEVKGDIGLVKSRVTPELKAIKI